MVYKHQQFVLDAESKKVFDENGKELRLTGNAYRMLVFLCKNKHGNLTAIGEYLDFANDYTENHIRQYRYKINSIIGYDIVEYKNGVYSLVGELRELDKIERNTDLLREDNVKSVKNIMDKINTKFIIVPAIIASALLLLSFFDWPYGYYTLLRVIVSIIAVYYAYYLYTAIKLQNFWFWALISIAILFNPIVPIYLGDKTIWGIIDVVVAGFFISLIIKFRKE
ncbi:hypothetical protein KKC63_03190 [Patescibacteria group bacterium]|nr:hypothetical protein [Patescibacteria group bacterium]MBU4023408.1 hypothetical protein [Patescibacteria group bacterium]